MFYFSCSSQCSKCAVYRTAARKITCAFTRCKRERTTIREKERETETERGKENHSALPLCCSKSKPAVCVLCSLSNSFVLSLLSISFTFGQCYVCSLLSEYLVQFDIRFARIHACVQNDSFVHLHNFFLVLRSLVVILYTHFSDSDRLCMYALASPLSVITFGVRKMEWKTFSYDFRATAAHT